MEKARLASMVQVMGYVEKTCVLLAEERGQWDVLVARVTSSELETIDVKSFFYVLRTYKTCFVLFFYSCMFYFIFLETIKLN